MKTPRIPAPLSPASAAKYRKMRTISSSQADDLVYENLNRRVWVSRCQADSETLQPLVSVEYLQTDGSWRVALVSAFNLSDI